MRHLLSVQDLTPADLKTLLRLAADVKTYPEKHRGRLAHKSLLMIFEKPSLRTHLSFSVAMAQLGGQAVYCGAQTAPFGSGKESMKDTAAVASRYVDVIMARLFEHRVIEELARHSRVPVINALTDYEHPCQTLGDLFTIQEKRRTLKVAVAYVGDGNNNVTHSLILGCALAGASITVGCPARREFWPNAAVLRKARRRKGRVRVVHDARQAVGGADVVYTDSWMSYHIPKEQEPARVKALKPFQVNAPLMARANKGALFMHCLPAGRGREVTDQVIDGKHSVVYDQAENRLHTEKALLIWLLKEAARKGT